MAKRKGKSRSRIKGWQQRYAAEGAQEASSGREKFFPRAVKLPPWRLEAPQENLDELPRVQGMVVGLFPGGAVVRCGKEALLCGLVGTFRAPEGSSALTLGDTVTVALAKAEHHSEAQADKQRADGMILARGPRRTALSRPQPRSAKRRDEYGAEVFEKVVAANMDVLLIVVATCQPSMRPALLDRFLIIAERGELRPVVVINKIDLRPADERLVADFRAMGVEVFTCSAITGAGIDVLRLALKDKRSVLAGPSGVGKSALVNALVPGANVVTREIRMKDQRGRHTTSTAIVYDLPDGGMLVDTPGVRELGMHLTRTELAWYFPELEAVAPQCKFNDCTHTHEPSCAVLAAVAAGKILPRRYTSYLRILETLEE